MHCMRVPCPASVCVFAMRCVLQHCQGSAPSCMQQAPTVATGQRWNTPSHCRSQCHPPLRVRVCALHAICRTATVSLSSPCTACGRPMSERPPPNGLPSGAQQLTCFTVHLHMAIRMGKPDPVDWHSTGQDQRSRNNKSLTAHQAERCVAHNMEQSNPALQHMCAPTMHHLTLSPRHVLGHQNASMHTRNFCRWCPSAPAVTPPTHPPGHLSHRQHTSDSSVHHHSPAPLGKLPFSIIHPHCFICQACTAATLHQHACLCAQHQDLFDHDHSYPLAD